MYNFLWGAFAGGLTNSISGGLVLPQKIHSESARGCNVAWAQHCWDAQVSSTMWQWRFPGPHTAVLLGLYSAENQT